ncbi:MAG: cytochrome P450 [Cyanobacteria bacterium J069]|nr:MAG: cytochrome P450 [Cyanobacteria bacterium J069]
MNSISGPSAPAPVQNLEWVFNPTAYMERAAQQYPDLFLTKAFGLGSQLVFVNHPQAIQEILSNDRKDFTAPGDLNTILTPLVGNTSIFLLSGEPHRRQRQLLMPPFHGDRMKVYGQLITDLTHRALARLPLQQPFLARSAMQSISLRVILEAVFGVQQSAEGGWQRS